MTRTLKIFGLAAAAALASMALVGASSAMAETTKLCEANEEQCSAENTYPADTEITTYLEAGTTAELTADNGVVVTCTESEVSGKITAEEGEPLPDEILTATWNGEAGVNEEECENNIGQTCEVTALGLPWETELRVTTVPDGVLTVKNPEAEVECRNTVCVWTAATVEVDVEGGNAGTKVEGKDQAEPAAEEPARVKAEEEPLEKKEGPNACGDEATWDATYIPVSPDPIHVTH